MVRPVDGGESAHVCKVQVHKDRLSQDHAMLLEPCTGCWVSVTCTIDDEGTGILISLRLQMGTDICKEDTESCMHMTIFVNARAGC